MKPDLYHHGTSVCSAKVRMALAEKGVGWNGRYIDTRKGEQRSPEYLKLNPNGLVPTLVHGPNVVIESTVINEYVDETFPGPALKPDDQMGRARMRIWTRRLDENIHMPATATLSFAIALRQVTVEKYASREALDAHIASKPNPLNREMHRQIADLGIEAPVVRHAMELFNKLLADMEAELERGPWLAGASFSLADIDYASYMTRLDCLRLEWLWDNRPHVAGWYERLKRRPTYRKAIADWLVKEEIDLMKENGMKHRTALQKLLSG